MTDSHVTDLNYGHVGLAVYDPDVKEWSFTRRPGSRRTLQPVGEPEVLIPAISSDSPQPDGLARQLHRESEEVLRSNPELHAAGHLLTEHARISKALSGIAARYDPVRGALVDFGRAADVDNKRSKGTVKIAALPGGRGGHALRLVQLRKERRGWGQDKSVWLNVPNLGAGETGWWSGNGAPIQQVCFAGTEDDRGTFLAVRTDTVVHLFRPLYHRAPVKPSACANSYERFPASRLEASPVVQIPIPKGKPAYADVTFNPWYQRQIATINQHGEWIIWDIEGTKLKTSTFRALLAKKGRIEEDRDTEKAEIEDSEDHVPAPKPHDGWFRVLWVGDANTIAVFSRGKVGLFNFRGDTKHLNSPDLGLTDTTDWILDAKKDPRSTDRIFVLTSSRLTLSAVRVPDEGFGKSDEATEAGARSLLSWRHFRDPEDTTLQMSIQAEEDETLVFVRSQQDTGVMVFRFPRHTDTTSLPATADPMLLQLASGRLGEASKPSVAVHVQPLGWGEDDRIVVTAGGPGRNYLNHGVLFFQAITVFADLEISQRLICSFDPASDPSDRPWKTLPPIDTPTWTRMIARPSSAWVAVGRFVVDDEMDDSEDDVDVPPWSSMRCHGRRKARLRVLDVHTEDDEPPDPWTVDNTRIPIYLQDDDSGRQESSAVVASFAEKLTAGLDIDNSEEQHYDTLYQLISSPVDVSDIDEVSQSFSRLLQHTPTEPDEDNPTLAVVAIAPAPILSLPVPQDEASWMSAIYEHVISIWLSAVPATTPNRLRLWNERQARRLAAELALASASLTIKRPQPHQDTIEDEEYQSQLIQGAEFSLPSQQLKGKGKAPPDSMSSASSHAGYLPSSQPPSSQLPPGSLPTPAATPSLTSASSMITDLSTVDDLGAATRLRQFTTFTKPQLNTTRQINRLLSHWNVGGDPELYNFEATSAALSHITNPDDEDMTDKERRRLEKKRLRHLKKQREEAAAAARAQALASQASQLSIRTQSQPQQPFSSPGPASRAGIMMPAASSQFAGMSSQVDPGSVFPASQVERGRFGGQPARKKKKRTVGF